LTRAERPSVEAVMSVKERRRRALRLAGIVLGNILVLIGLFAATEFVLHRVYNWQNPFIDHGENRLRTHDPVLTHALRTKFDGYDVWGPVVLRTFTNSLGFKDASARDVPLLTDRRRILFIGDSFTEGVGVPFEKTFVGRFAQAFPEAEVLNAGVATFAPSVYYARLKQLLEMGLQIDEVVVYIDISDIQDEAIYYQYDQNKTLQLGVFVPDPQQCFPIPRPLVAKPARGWLEKNSFAAEFLNDLLYSKRAAAANERASLAELQEPGRIYSRDWGRGGWTFNADASCYGALGIEGGILKAKLHMDQLHALLSKMGVPLSVGVYPWPQQLFYDVENSRQAQIWRDWCAGKCKRFLDHYPAFFRYKAEHPDWVRDLYFWGDMHFNENGHGLLAGDLVEQFRE
jgi:hypothetical protein